ncbi:CD3G isoform 2 [Pan troglodytes]|uniref:CD3 gamma subunit of T-cell receptor complex n=3 Tax=Hominidae TaxID=9604 RepID=J3KNA5_HUMAN|nr:CD3G isoform 2 [Pan troglodytes]PNJ75711.1 CD3G isoform 2 [Pongo abelii]
MEQGKGLAVLILAIILLQGTLAQSIKGRRNGFFLYSDSEY